MITLHIFTEEVSAKNVFDAILPKILSESVSYRIYPHQGKQDLENALRTSLPSISKIPGSKVLITRDQDSADCRIVKNDIQRILDDNCHCDYSIRIVCKELESWFLGDSEAIKKAFPRFKPEQYRSKRNIRNVDKITNPSKYLLKIIPDYTNNKKLPKLAVSENIAGFLDFGK